MGPTSIRSAVVHRSRFLGMLSALLLLFVPLERAASLDEYEIKALFLFHFAGFVEWPPTAFANERSPLIIGIVGEDPFGHYLDAVVVAEMAQGRQLVIERFPRASDVTFCHVLFISRSVDNQLDAILARLEGQPVLTVGESENFARKGGVIRFLAINNKTRFRINVTAAKEANLVISSKLLRSADVIAPAKGKS
jgi:hypothetical protein